MADAVASGLISDALVEKLKELEEKKKKAENELLMLRSETSTVNIDTNMILLEYNEVSKSPNLPNYRGYITNFIDRIEVGKYTVDVTLKTGLDVYPELNNTYHIRRQEVYEQNG